MTLFKYYRLALLSAVLLAFSAMAQAGEMTVALGSEPTTLDPQSAEDGSERAVNDNVYETLMVRTTDGQLTTGLAAFDYSIGDRWVNEGGRMQALATEKVIELPPSGASDRPPS